MLIFSYPSVLKYVLGAQKNRLIETVLLSTHNICFGWEARKLKGFFYSKIYNLLLSILIETVLLSTHNICFG